VDALGTATLTADIPKQRAVSVSVSRQQIASVLAADGTPELRLDLTSADGSEGATATIEWRRDDLERLLASAEDDVTLIFDAAQLTIAFDDVEAHGLRGRAALFAVAAVGSLGAGASIANAAEQQATASDPAATAALQVRSEAMNEAYGLDSTAAIASGSDSASFSLGLVGGAVLLTIAGATFAIRQTGPPRPA
jgi:hypothetical protein